MHVRHGHQTDVRSDSERRPAATSPLPGRHTHRRTSEVDDDSTPPHANDQAAVKWARGVHTEPQPSHGGGGGVVRGRSGVPE